MATVRIANTHSDRASILAPLKNSPLIATIRAANIIIGENAFKAIESPTFTVKKTPIKKVEAILVMASAIEITAVSIDLFLIFLTIDREL